MAKPRIVPCMRDVKTVPRRELPMRESFKPRLGKIRICAHTDGGYTLDPTGELAAIMDVVDRNGELADLVAWFPDNSRAWWLRYGDHPILGAEALAIAQYHCGAIRLHATPEDWLAGAVDHWCRITAGRFPHSPYSAFCILRWDIDLREALEGTGSIVCDDLELQKRFRRILRQWEPRVTVARQGGVLRAA